MLLPFFFICANIKEKIQTVFFKGKILFLSAGEISKLYKNISVQVKFNISYGSADPLVFTKAACFSKVLHEGESVDYHKENSKGYTHIFSIKLPLLQADKQVCLTGSAAQMNSFDRAKPVFFKRKKNGKATVKLDLSEAQFPVEYKLAVFDTDTQTIIEYEPGANRLLEANYAAGKISLAVSGDLFKNYLWKGAGVNLPLFSVRSQHDWGSGDFGSLKKLADHAALCGLKLIQLLPLNDTTATHSHKDSYPYAAISAFALHPMLLDAEKMAAEYPELITSTEKETIKKLHALSYVDQNSVVKLKLGVVSKIFEEEKNSFQEDKRWLRFFKKNHHWLTPYAVFCGLRDQFGTADVYAWNENALYDADRVQQLASPESDLYETVLCWMFVQYQLHLQLKSAVRYAHNKGIILKADLPIGVGRYSVDTWMHPELFNMQMQAGAPPDAFSDWGQNWKFPTYNMAEMKKDNYAWFRKRMKQIARYFDAVRIDHVLGFFRIWSIPLEFTDGRMGRFVPAITFSKNDLINAGIAFNEDRYCLPFSADDETDVILLKAVDGFHFRINMQRTASYKNLPETERKISDDMYQQYFYVIQDALWKKEGSKKLGMLKNATNMMNCAEDLGMVPDFVTEVLHQTGMLSLRVQQMPNAADQKFSDTTAADYGSVVMPATHDMQPVRLWWEENRADAQLFFNDVLKEHGAAPYFCEPWICKMIIAMHLQSPAMWSIFLLQDLLAMDENLRRRIPSEERINDPANADQVWNYRLHIDIEQLMNEIGFNEMLKAMVKESGR